MKKTNRQTANIFLALLIGLYLSVSAAYAQTEKPNIFVIWGDDIGRTNISVFSKGVMGYRTPNIDRIANEGMLFTDAYADQSCRDLLLAHAPVFSHFLRCRDS